MSKNISGLTMPTMSTFSSLTIEIAGLAAYLAFLISALENDLPGERESSSPLAPMFAFVCYSVQAGKPERDHLLAPLCAVFGYGTVIHQSGSVGKEEVQADWAVDETIEKG